MLLEELRQRGYYGGRTILTEFVQPLRSPRQEPATVRFETEPGVQAQVDFGTFKYPAVDGTFPAPAMAPFPHTPCSLGTASRTPLHV